MPVTLEYAYNKKLGLPGFSSHGVSASIRVDAESVAAALEQMPLLYQMLQAQVDADLQGVGYMPDFRRYGHAPQPATVAPPAVVSAPAAQWACTPEQRKMISAFARQQKLKRPEVDALCVENFKEPVDALNPDQAARLIQILIERRAANAKQSEAVPPLQTDIQS